MANNKKRAQAPKRFNRHDSKVMSKRLSTGLGMRGPRSRDERASVSMSLRSGSHDGW